MTKFQYNKTVDVMSEKPTGVPPILQSHRQHTDSRPIRITSSYTTTKKVLNLPFTSLNPEEKGEQSNQTSSVKNDGTYPAIQSILNFKVENSKVIKNTPWTEI